MSSLLPDNSNNSLAAGLDMMSQNGSLLRMGSDVWERVRQGFQMTEVNPELVQRQERFYASHPDLFNRTLDRSHKYLYYILSEVERRGMPSEIALLPMVESSFVPTAASPVGAAGLWQFMPLTGRHYGLEQTWWYDGRRDVMAATNAALDYLQNLYAQFGDWSLALAAYNWGEGNLARSIARTQAAGLTPTYENIRMPNETRNYVPKLLAVRNLLANPDNFGLRLDNFPNKPYFVAVSPERHMDITLAAKLADISVSEFKALNPAFNLPVYAYKAGRQMLLPANRADLFEANLAKWDKPLLTWQVYTPANTESVAEVASRVGMSSAQLMTVNHVNSRTLSAGRPVLIAMQSGDAGALIPTDKPMPDVAPAIENSAALNSDVATAPAQTATNIPQPATQLVASTIAPAATVLAAAAPAPAEPVASSETAAPAPILIAHNFATPSLSTQQPVKVAEAEPVPQMAQAAATQHTVVAGDTLYNIARRFNLTVPQLKALNGIHGNQLILGQTLRLKSQPVVEQMAQQADAQSAAPATPAAALPAEYVVQRGDTVYSIARHFGIDHAVIQRLNSARTLERLHPGQVLRLQQI